MPLPAYADLATLPEDKRIEIIGRCVAIEKLTVAIALEDEPKKIASYKTKLMTRHPDMMEFEQLPGLVPNTVLLKVRPKADSARP